MTLHCFARTVFLLLAAVGTALTTHIPRAESLIITQPNALVAWTLGTIETVTWTIGGLDLDGVNGTVLMGFAFTNGTIQLWKDQPLATDVALADGIVNVRCPLNLPTSFRYVVAQYGHPVVWAVLGNETSTSPPFQVIDINDHDVNSNVDISTLPVALSTLGSVPPATITRTSVVATILPSLSSIGTTGAAQATDTKKQSANAHGALTPKGGSWHVFPPLVFSGLFMAVGGFIA
ncbi:hypothetical protein PYCCODRAFT_622110 [Trametes coccinea BRFM310]|uniref:DOMON domain-containing protein n=1 Tax=Trametes coccinea (strain BRFM310) TaxID=1353009 RepID=A0A1Y2J281_TRAC3|nr:hypothetical protein PYCCODRAFT_622110 [Trametes coccinea BRFM310]